VNTYQVPKLPSIEKLNGMLPPGTIGVLSGDLTRYTEFSQSMFQLAYPPGSKMAWVKSVDIVGAQNQILGAAEGDWVWIMGDDHVFPPETLVVLLGDMYSKDLDVVVPLCLQRFPPFAPVVYKSQNESGSYYVYDDLPEKGLVQVHAAGNAGMLIRKRVLEKLEPPYVGTDGKGLNEDLFFCRRIREAGFKIWCDVDVRLGHINSFAIWPKRSEQGWAVGIRFDAENEYTVYRSRTAQPPVPSR
jgi:hypothetical protein